jgi:ABC-type Mn2+/Zn2+ transport system ATPase subunit
MLASSSRSFKSPSKILKTVSMSLLNQADFSRLTGFSHLQAALSCGLADRRNPLEMGEPLSGLDLEMSVD